VGGGKRLRVVREPKGEKRGERGEKGGAQENVLIFWLRISSCVAKTLLSLSLSSSLQAREREGAGKGGEKE
jgi:hypothetical protein